MIEKKYLENKQNKLCTFIQWNIIQLLKLLK